MPKLLFSLVMVSDKCIFNVMLQCCDGNCPPCEKPCARTLRCGNHKCTSVCHCGPCYPCPLTAEVKCRCGLTVLSVPCGRKKQTRPPHCNRPCRCRCLIVIMNELAKFPRGIMVKHWFFSDSHWLISSSLFILYKMDVECLVFLHFNFFILQCFLSPLWFSVRRLVVLTVT